MSRAYVEGKRQKERRWDTKNMALWGGVAKTPLIYPVAWKVSSGATDLLNASRGSKQCQSMRSRIV